MTYNEYEESQTNSQPYELYEFIGTYESYYYTSDLNSHTFNSKTYEPVAGLFRSEIVIGTHEETDNTVSIEMPIDIQLVKDYAFQVTPPELIVNIYRLQRAESSDYKLYLTGTISAISTENNIATFTIPTLFSEMLSGNVPTIYVQTSCNHVLFDDRCGVSRTSNSVTTTVSSITDNQTIVVSSTGSFDEGWFEGGELLIVGTGERRTISSQSGTTMVVNYVFADISIGDSIQITAGCDHSFDGEGGCPKFSNQAKFGGCPFVPGESNNFFRYGIS